MSGQVSIVVVVLVVVVVVVDVVVFVVVVDVVVLTDVLVLVVVVVVVVEDDVVVVVVVDVVVVVVVCSEPVTDSLIGTLAISSPLFFTISWKSYVFPAVREFVFTSTWIVLLSAGARLFMSAGLACA